MEDHFGWLLAVWVNKIDGCSEPMTLMVSVMYVPIFRLHGVNILRS